MATTLSTFKSALTYGGARPSLFEFAVTAAPTGVSSSLSGVNLYCNVSEIPPLTLTPIERQYKGRTVKIPGDMVFGDLSTTIINTEKFNVRNEVEKWMEGINGSVDNISESDADFGTGTAVLTHFQKGGAKTMEYTFVDIWPTALGEIALSYDTASDVEQFDVTWAYNYYTHKGSGAVTAFSTQN
jgi:hypothetical protein|tara:strand:+ start:65 stop:619 length:555 start_codon:yes stop_codon:yes gene_type:complete